MPEWSWWMHSDRRLVVAIWERLSLGRNKIVIFICGPSYNAVIISVLSDTPKHSNKHK